MQCSTSSCQRSFHSKCVSHMVKRGLKVRFFVAFPSFYDLFPASVSFRPLASQRYPQHHCSTGEDLQRTPRKT